MSAFPFGHPAPTAGYLSLYALTLAVHLVAVGYVLGGSGVVAASALFGARRESGSVRLAALLRDWLPFALGAAITAGVAPLLFVQILYKESYYTANLLLFGRWMAILPALIAGFYLLYLAKSERASRWPRPARAAISVIATLCFGFTAYSFTENHLLALDRDTWVAFYAEGRHTYAAAGVWPRMLFFAAGTLPSMALVAGWQLSGAKSGPNAAALLSRLALAGLAAAALFGFAYSRTLGAESREALLGPAAAPHLGLAALGALIQLAAWFHQHRLRRLSRAALSAATLGLVLTAIGTVCAREVLRLSHFDVEALYAHHRRAAESGGAELFFFFLLVNGGVIAWCLRSTRRALRERV